MSESGMTKAQAVELLRLLGRIAFLLTVIQFVVTFCGVLYLLNGAK